VVVCTRHIAERDPAMNVATLSPPRTPYLIKTKYHAPVATVRHPTLMLMRPYKKEMEKDREVMEHPCRNA